MLDECSVSVLGKGYYSISAPLQLRPNATLVGVGRLYSNLVPHPDVPPVLQPGKEPWPLLRTATTGTILS